MAFPAEAQTIAASPRTPEHRWLALVVIAVAQLMVALDATIVNIALPSAQAALGFSDSDRQWVITAYTLSFGGLLLLGGRIADHVGRRRAFLAGLAGFAAASAIAGAASGFEMLVAGRALQGAFAALLTPTALSMVAVTFTEPRERAKAFGVYGAVASSGGAGGLLLGGALTEYLDWRWCLYLISAALITTGLAAIVYGCSQAVPHGWTSLDVIGPLAAGALAVGLFTMRQARSAAPLLPLQIVTDRARAGAYISVAAAVVGSFGMFLMLTYYFQVVLHYSPLRAGLAFLPLAVAVSASAYGLGSRLLPRVAPRTLIAPGLLVAAAGLGLLTQLDPASRYLTLILPAELLLGLGMGCVFTPCISVATSGVEPRDAGVAAAAATTSMQVGGSIGTAVLNTIAVTATASYLSSHAGSVATVNALVHGYATAIGWAAVLLVAVAAVAMVMIRSLRPPSNP
jgi:MFS family permease